MYEEEWEEEEHLIVIELKGVIDSDFLYKCKSESCRLLGIDTDEPVLQIGNYTFTGELKESSDSQETKKLKYRYNTTKTLEMARVFLVKKDSAEKEEEEVAGSSKETLEEQEDPSMDIG
ncbi:general transcription factor 3C polypeptide 6-like isoform X2 [Porites lutea]|uniref:general transcription factor 3C polypeptide 6-like isoform X2 n=1 Tax=Porites lutea TaxID=51062 RepID=UPI003CC5B03D